MMHTWEITGAKPTSNNSKSSEFDAALKKARRIDYNYSAGRVID